MKRIIAIAAFFVVTLLSTDAAMAQQKTANIHTIAKGKTHALAQKTTLTGEQQSKIYGAYLSYERNMNSLKGKSNVDAARDKYTQSFLKTIEKVLSPKQYEAFLKDFKKTSK